jgi:hypothetical protein
MKKKFKRKSSISNWITSRRDKWVKITTWSQSSDMMRKRKFKMLYYSRKKKRLNNQKWSSNKTSKRKDKIILELSKKIRWRIKSDCNQRDSHKWRSRKKEEESKWWPEGSMRINAKKRSN